MRDLDTLRMSTVGDKEEQVEAIRSRFSPERWEAYKRDARYFREVMGTPHYLDTMHDMGGNATPVWMSIAYLLFNNLDPSEGAFVVTGLFDLVLLLFMFVMIGRTFGLRTMLVSAAIFGANDFIMYGTNWGGATLRHDWLAYLGLAACALKPRALPAGRGAARLLHHDPRLPRPDLRGGHACPRSGASTSSGGRPAPARPGASCSSSTGPPCASWLGGVAAMAVLFAFSAAVLPVRAWGDWLHKVVQLSSDPHPSHLSLRSLIAGWESNQHAILRARLPLFIAAAWCSTWA